MGMARHYRMGALMQFPKRETAPPHPVTNSSGKPPDISQDVWDDAKRHMSAVGWHAPSMIRGAAAAILAERERCAIFIETMAVARGYAGGGIRGAEFVRRTNPSASASVIADAIRTPTQAHADAGGDTL